MSSSLQIPPGFDNAPKNERIAFVEALWDRIAQDDSQLPVSEEQKRILDERLAAFKNDNQAGQPWSEVRERLLGQFTDS